MPKQIGFYFDAGRCVQCHACEVACKSLHATEVGPHWRRVLNRWDGEYPRVTNTSFSVSCFHCAKPACEPVCPASAIHKSAETGIVSVNRKECIGCRSCSEACPYGAPQFGHDGKMQKCDLCADRVNSGREPVCVATCAGDALRFGDLAELARLAEAKQAQLLPGLTLPSVFVAPVRNAAQIAVDLKTLFNKPGVKKSSAPQRA